MARIKMDWMTLTEEDADRRRSALRTLLADFDVPAMRLDFTRRNLNWIRRNLAVRNANKPMFSVAMELVIWLLRWDERHMDAG